MFDYCVEVENLQQLEDDTKADLCFILHYQRFLSLSWELEWNKLKEYCKNIFKIFENNFKDIELKYRYIDYNKFKDLPINDEDGYGIEKGYEHFIITEPELDTCKKPRYYKGGKCRK